MMLHLDWEMRFDADQYGRADAGGVVGTPVDTAI
jgi:hypothetical protein